MPINVSGRNYMLDQLKSQVTWVALFNNVPAEISGGGYARQSVTYGTASNGSVSATNQPAFSIPAGAVVATIRLFTASTGGTEHAIFDAVDETYGGAGTYTVSSITLSAN